MNNIDFETENIVNDTIFFNLIERNGIAGQLCTVNYLSFLRMESDDTLESIADLRQLLEEHPETYQHDIEVCLTVRNWRPHLVACVSMMLTECIESLPTLWQKIAEGSWASPQLCLTAFLLDPDFKENALSTLNQDIRKDSYIMLYTILMACCSYSPSNNLLEKYASFLGKRPDEKRNILPLWLKNISQAIQLNNSVHINNLERWLENSNNQNHQ